MFIANIQTQWLHKYSNLMAITIKLKKNCR